MATNNREAAIAITLGYEGGYTNHPSDPGGPTNWGITIHDARMYWKKDATATDVRRMPKSVAIDIYRKKYWAKMKCDNDPAGVDLVTFDYGVNSGVAKAGPVRDRLKDPDPVVWAKKICRQRLSFVQGLRTWSVFGKGWGRRIADVEAKGVKMALTQGKNPKTVSDDLKKEAKQATNKSASSGGGAVTTGGGATASPHWLPDWSSLDLTTKIGVIVAGIVITIVIGYFVWWAVQHRHRAKAYQAAAKA